MAKDPKPSSSGETGMKMHKALAMGKPVDGLSMKGIAGGQGRPSGQPNSTASNGKNPYMGTVKRGK